MAQPCNPLLTAPHRIATVALTVRDLGRVAGFYRDALGLAPLGEGAGEVTLGVGRVPLLRLRGDPGAAPGSPREAGLFHTAFLLPTRADLAQWLLHAA
ncbi:MAG TPA: VOC family protein, partial [Salinarimonas sp.]|nr:VOC family protein [Salinarimonas sp.]